MLYALVVIYNKSCEESLTLSRIISSNNDIKVIVFDNSIKEFGNKIWCDEHGIFYYSLSKNIGLSRAYNYVIDKIEHNSKDYIMILDDDTDLTDDYFKEAKKIISDDEYEVILPVVNAGKFIMSPCIMQFGCKPSKIKNAAKISKIDMKKISAINSGMIIRTDVFDCISYDESMFLDCVDHDFMNQVRRLQKSVHIMNSMIFQNYSMTANVSLKSAINRFEIQTRDLKVYYKKYHHLGIYKLYIIWIAIKLSIKYNSNVFWKVFLACNKNSGRYIC